MADTAVPALPNTAAISSAPPTNVAADPNAKLLAVMTALLHSNPPVSSVDQASPEVKQAAGDKAKAGIAAETASAGPAKDTVKPTKPGQTSTHLPDVLKLLGIDMPGGQGSADGSKPTNDFEGTKIGKAAKTITSLLALLG